MDAHTTPAENKAVKQIKTNQPPPTHQPQRTVQPLGAGHAFQRVAAKKYPASIGQPFSLNKKCTKFSKHCTSADGCNKKRSTKPTKPPQSNDLPIHKGMQFKMASALDLADASAWGEAGRDRPPGLRAIPAGRKAVVVFTVDAESR